LSKYEDPSPLCPPLLSLQNNPLGVRVRVRAKAKVRVRVRVRAYLLSDGWVHYAIYGQG